MKEIKVKALNREDFDKFGSYVNMINPDTSYFGDDVMRFYRDMLPIPVGTSGTPCFSVCWAAEREMKVDFVEYHDYTPEGILPLDNDIVLYLAPASKPGEVPLDEFEAFRVPKGTLVMLRAGVWHYGPLPLAKVANTLIFLPERTYGNDCEVVELKPSEQMKIVL